MQYTENDYLFLGKQVAQGKYISYTTFILALILSLLVGMAIGRYILPQGAISLPSAPGGSFERDSEVTSAINPSKQLMASIIQHEEEIRQNPEDPTAWAHLGNLYYDAGEPQKSVDAYEKSLALEPGNTSVLVDCGVMYRELENYEKALEYFQKALTIDPNHEIALFNTGVVLFHDLDRREDALGVWRRLVSLNPKAKTPRGGLVSDLIKEHESR